jgi:hypothetical protein
MEYDAGWHGEMNMNEQSTHPTITAYHLYDGKPIMPLVPAPSQRDWMDATPQKFARRCLPLLVANQAGWLVLNSHAIKVTWDGGIDKSALHIEYQDGAGPGYAVSHFGSGILTFSIPFIFKTSHGYNLLVRGPANMPKDGISALEGIVESDWCRATFTMNWKFTRTGLPIIFEVGEPLCMIVPQKRGELEAFTPRMRNITEEPEMLAAYTSWASERAAFLTDLNVPGSEACRREWQKDYFQAKGVTQHQTKLALASFQEVM